MELAKIFGSYVATRRKELEMSQTLLAERAGISRALLIKIESEGSNAAIENVSNLLKALNSSFTDFDQYLKKMSSAKSQLEGIISNSDLETIVKKIKGTDE